MAFENKKSPYNPGYAIPKYVLKEPAGRGTFTTRWRPRGSIDVLPPGSPSLTGKGSGYALPKNVKKEVPGMGTLTTAYVPRGSTFFRPGDTLASSSLRPSSFSANTLAITSLSGTTLGGSTLGNDKAAAGSPLQTYGSKGATILCRALSKVPQNQQGEVLKAMLDSIDPKLYAKVSRQMQKGVARKVAIEKALTEGFTKEIMDLGKGRKPTKTKQVSLAMGYTPVGFLDKLSSGIQGIASGAVNAVGDLACKVASNPLTAAAAVGASAAYGATTEQAATGAVVAQGLCSKGTAPAPAVPYERTSWVLPAAIFGGGLLLVLIARRKK